MRKHFALEKPRPIQIAISGYDDNKARAHVLQIEERRKKLKIKMQKKQAKDEQIRRETAHALAAQELCEFDQLNQAMQFQDTEASGQVSPCA